MSGEFFWLIQWNFCQPAGHSTKGNQNSHSAWRSAWNSNQVVAATWRLVQDQDTHFLYHTQENTQRNQCPFFCGIPFLTIADHRREITDKVTCIFIFQTGSGKCWILKVSQSLCVRFINASLEMESPNRKVSDESVWAESRSCCALPWQEVGWVLERQATKVEFSQSSRQVFTSGWYFTLLQNAKSGSSAARPYGTVGEMSLMDEVPMWWTPLLLCCFPHGKTPHGVSPPPHRWSSPPWWKPPPMLEAPWGTSSA